MSKLFLGFIVAIFAGQTPAARADSSCIVSPFQSTSTSAAGILFSCPQGDGDLLGAKGLTITVTALACFSPVPGIPATDIWVVGCSNNLLLCSAHFPFVSGSTDMNGTIVLDGRLYASGCDNSGLRVLVQGVPFQQCLPIQTRSADLKSSGAGACGGDLLCPDGIVNLADYSYFVTKYPASTNPAPPYLACADLASPYGSPIGLQDFALYATHFAGSHACH